MKTRDPRIATINRLQAELKAEYEAKERVRAKAGEERRKVAEQRLVLLDQRLARFGLDNFFSTGVHTVMWDKNGAQPEIWICIDGGKSVRGGSEGVANRLVDHLETLIKEHGRI